ncbi:hypothetical protein WH47_09814 [Habropoda laboriosa]|uniref:Uncharacterized protein n=1 Tax=Habropoda laboriosa TaxID=597456 RepID=A0A0L7R2Y0_9HYME|nr:hypothetical protein WH47_09814 [Habropoda laboriosa]
MLNQCLQYSIPLVTLQIIHTASHEYETVICIVTFKRRMCRKKLLTLNDIDKNKDVMISVTMGFYE